MKKHAISFCLLLLIPLFTYVGGWRGIVPLRSTREEVARILGPPAPGLRDQYELERESVFIIYSDGKCGAPGNAGWDVPPGTVVEIRVTPKTRLKLSQLGVDKDKYRKEENRLSGGTFYTDFERGVGYSVSGEDEVVNTIFYMPTAGQESLRCAEAAAGRARSEAEREGYLAGLGGRQEERPYRLLDQYSDFGSDEERAHLDNLAALLKEQPDVLGYVVVYGGRYGCRGEAQAHALRVKSYLARAGGAGAERVVTVDGGYRQKLTVELYLVPRGAPAPTPSPSVAASEVREREGGCAEERKRRASQPRRPKR